MNLFFPARLKNGRQTKYEESTSEDNTKRGGQRRKLLFASTNEPCIHDRFLRTAEPEPRARLQT